MSEIKQMTIKEGDIIMDYCTFGEGEKPFVILPGMSLRSVLNFSGAIAEQFSRIAKLYRVYVFDRRKLFPEDYSVRQMAHDTAAVMKAVGIKEAVLYGASQGAMIAQWIAIDHPELAGRLVLCSSSSRETERSHRLMVCWEEMARAGRLEELVKSFCDVLYTPVYVKANAGISAGLCEGVTKEDLDRFAQMARATMTDNSYYELEKISCRSLVVGAWKDQVIGPEGSIELARKLKCDTYIDGTYGHAVYDEMPGFVDCICDYLMESERK